MTTVALFGAGASHGSGGIVPHAPPLGGGVFTRLRAEFPQSWGALAPELSRALDRDFERGMVRLANANQEAIPPLMKDMTEYFARFQLDSSGDDLYSHLLAGIPDGAFSEILFSTLNYECVLEEAISRRGFALDYGNGIRTPTAHVERVSVWKLHGSCNFRLQSPQLQGLGLAWGGPGLVIDGPIDAVQLREIRNWLRGPTALYAAMCLFTVNKPAQIGAQAIGRQQRAWSRRVCDADQVIVVGTRYHPEDRHLWDALTSTPASVYFVGSSAGFEEWRSARNAGPVTFIGPRFNSAIPELQTLMSAP